MPEIFGFDLFSFLSKKQEKKKDNIEKQLLDEPSDGAIVVETEQNDIYGGRTVGSINYEQIYKTENDLIKRYRNMALQPECEDAIDEILTDAMVCDEGEPPVKINLDGTSWKDGAKAKITEEFDKTLKLLEFNKNGYEIFKRWYIDGRISYQKIPFKNKKKGLAKLQYIDALSIRKVKEVVFNRDQHGGARTIQETREFFIFTPHEAPKQRTSVSMSHSSVSIKVAAENIAHVTSGIFDPQKQLVLSHLHKAIKPLNQLIMLEDSVVIYRISRAPERRVFYIDVGNLPRTRAESYLQGIMNKFRNKIIYDAGTGEVKNNKKHQAMTEDYWLPRREGKSGTEITTLNGAQNLGEIEDIQYFRKKLFKSLNIPLSRLEQDRMFAIGRSNEIARDEVRFGKYVSRLRRRFSELFNDVLKTQLLLKGLVSVEEWEDNRDSIEFEYQNNSYLAEMKSIEIMRERFQLAQDAESFVGEYLSREWIKKKIFKLDDGEIKDLMKQIEKEKSSGEISDEEMDDAGEFAGTNAPKEDTITNDDPAGEVPATPKEPKEKPEDEEKDKKKEESKENSGLLISELRKKLNIIREESNE